MANVGVHLYDVLRFIIRVIPEGKASDYLMALPLGTMVNMTGPHGFFVLDPAHAGDVVFAATGTGIAAVMPTLRGPCVILDVGALKAAFTNNGPVASTAQPAPLLGVQ